jgi:hypothetical protein
MWTMSLSDPSDAGGPVRDTTPMRMTNSRAYVDRQYAETGAFQWVRETALNAIEANATRIHYGVDWNGVEASGVYRRIIADNGDGMDAAELVEFFLTLGGTSKPIGGAHENYGIGAKVSLLPWNTAGLVVASWKAGYGNVIWMRADAETKQYGLRIVEFEGATTDVWETTDDPDLGFDLEQLRQDWIKDHGTVLLLLGDRLDQHTILNDPRHDPAGSRQLDDYLSRRFWSLPDGVRIEAIQMSGDPDRWPRKETFHSGHGSQRRYVEGSLKALGKLCEAKGVRPLPDGTRVHWFLRDLDAAPERVSGYIAALYRDELYEHKTHHSAYRRFGIGHANVRKNLWLIVEPPLAGQDRRGGVFPESDRNGLLWNSGAGENLALPWDDWADSWTRDMPDEVKAAISAEMRGGGITDDAYIERLSALFGDRWKIRRREVSNNGSLTVDPSEGIRRRRRRGAGESNRQTDEQQEPRQGADDGAEDAKPTAPQASLPTWEICGEDDIEPGMVASYMAVPRPGVVQLNIEHPVIKQQVEHWTRHYPHDPDAVRVAVHAVYGEHGVAVVAHSEQLKNCRVPMATIREDIRSPKALTAAMLGLIVHDAEINKRLIGKLGGRRSENGVMASTST